MGCCELSALRSLAVVAVVDGELGSTEGQEGQLGARTLVGVVLAVG